MNQGFFGFPNISIKDRPDVLIKEFDSSGTFVIPPFAKRLYILLVGAGGSGGSGARQPSGTNSGGGSGGGGGRYFIDDLPLSVLNAPPGTVLTVVIGAGGSASIGASVDGTTGANGSNGGNSSITIEGKRGNLIVSTGGAVGAPGTTAASATGAAGTTSWWFGNVSGIGHGGGNSSVTNYPQGPGTTPLPASSVGMWNWQSNGGCGGGGVDGTTNTACYGGAPTAGGLVTSQYSTLYSSGNNVIQTGAPNDPTIYTYNPDSVGYTIAGAYTPGMGGVGGGGGATTDGGRGRNGWRGGGGGGGGGARNGFNGGNGGAGGDGYCVLIAY